MDMLQDLEIIAQHTLWDIIKINVPEGPQLI